MITNQNYFQYTKRLYTQYYGFVMEVLKTYYYQNYTYYIMHLLIYSTTNSPNRL